MTSHVGWREGGELIQRTSLFNLYESITSIFICFVASVSNASHYMHCVYKENMPNPVFHIEVDNNYPRLVNVDCHDHVIMSKAITIKKGV